MRNHTSTKTEDMIQRMRSSRGDPIRTDYVGDPSTNSQILGPTRHKEIVPVKKTILTKYENKRRDAQATTGLYDWRTNVSVNNEGKVLPNYYLNALNKRAKDKVINKPSVDYKTQQFEGFQRNEPVSFHDIHELNGDSGMMSFRDSVNPTTYNPLLSTREGNRHTGTDPGYPDERMTHYSGERSYISSGDRLKQAREFSTTAGVKERRALQDIANQSLNGVVRAPKHIGTSFGQGINNNYEDRRPEVQTGVDTRRREDDVVPRSSDFQRQHNIKGISDNPEYQQEINRNTHNSETFNRTVNTEPHSFQLSFFSKLFEEVKKVLWIGKDTQVARQRLDRKNNVNEYTDDTISGVNPNDRISDLETKGTRRMYVVEKGKIHEYTDEYKDGSSGVGEISKSMSVLRLNESIVVRSIATRESHVIRILQRHDNITDGTTSYVTTSIPSEVFEDIMGNGMSGMRKKYDDPGILNLNFDEHVKLAMLIEQLPDKMKYESGRPSHHYQRDILNDPETDCLTNFSPEAPDDYERRRQDFRETYKSSNRTYASEKEYTGDSNSHVHEGRNDSRDKQYLQQNKSTDSKKMISRFNSEM